VTQESQRKVALLEAMVTALRDRLHEEEGRNEELQGGLTLELQLANLSLG